MISARVACFGLIFGFAALSGGPSPAELAKTAQNDLAAGRYAECVATSTKAAAAWHVLGRRSDEANVLTTRGQARFYSGDMDGALQDFELGLRIARELGDREEEVTRLNNVGSVFYAQARYGEALRTYETAEQTLAQAKAEKWFSSRQRLTEANLAVLYQRIGQYHRALELYQEMNPNPEALPVRERAQLMSNMGTLYRRLSDPVTALEKYRGAQELFHQSELLSGEVGVLTNIGIAETMDLKDSPAAVRTFSRAVELAEQSGGKRLILTARLYRGEAHLRAAELVDAEGDFEASRELANALDAREELWRSDYGLARVAEAQGNVPRSDEFLRNAIRTIEQTRSSVAASTGRSGFLIDRRQVYDLFIQHQCQAAKPDLATIFQLMEESRARDLQDRRHTRAASLGELQKRIPSDALVLEYWTNEQTLALIRISRDEVRLTVQHLSSDAFEGLHGLTQILADASRADWEAAAGKVSTVLLKGADLKRSRVRNVLISPDGELTRIPFETLPIEGGKNLLIDIASVTYVPYASAFETRSERASWCPPWKTVIEAFADPADGRDSTKERVSVAGLPESVREVREAAHEVGGYADLHIGAEARREYLSRPAPLLHLATHAFADPEDAERSYILLAPEARTGGFDHLFLREAARLPLANTTLVAVPACDSGAGKFVRGEGVASFSSAFLAAGARAAVTSLWRVGDRSSAEMMSRFYSSLAEGMSVTDALREAKMAFRRSGTAASHPAHWAALVLSGDGNASIPRVLGWTTVIGMAAGFVGIIAFGAVWWRSLRTKAGTA